MTKPQPTPALKQRDRRATRSVSRDRVRRKRRENRHSLLQSLETRQLLAGPDLIGIQPNEGSLLFDGTVLNVSPRELVFRFDDNSQIDPQTLSAIRVTRSGDDRVFESATATTDMGTGGQVLLEFRAVQSGSLGNGITVRFTTASRTNSSLPIITVVDRAVTINVNSNPLRPTRVQDLLSAVANDAEASAIIEVIQVSGPSLGEVGTTVTDGLTLTLSGANAAQAITDFGTNGQVLVRLVSQIPGIEGRGALVQVEQRNFGGRANPVVVVTDQVIRVQLNSAPGFESTAADFINAINANPDANRVVIASLEQGDANTAIGNRPPTYSPITLGGVSDVVVEPGFIGLGDTTREVVFRFAEPLPDDLYQIDILGTGPFALRNVDGEFFQDGEDLTRRFSINLGPQVLAVVPEPVRRRADGTLSPDTGKIEVHFNDDDLAPALAQNKSFYQLVFTADTVDNRDDVIIEPTSVVYSNITNIATLDFSRPLSRIPVPGTPGQFLTGAARLRVGTSEGLPARPTQVSLLLDPNNAVEPADTFSDAFDLNENDGSPGNTGINEWKISSTTTSSALLRSEIFNATPYDLDLPGPDVPGTRDIRPDDPSRLLRTVPLDYLRNGADVVDGISVIQYNFAPSWLGDDPNRPGIVADTTYFNVISDQQKQRVREVLQLYSEYLGISFVEVEGEPTSPAFFSIAVGDLYGGDERATSGDGGIAVVTRDRNLDGINDLGVMDFQDFDESIDDQFGGEFFRGAMFAVGQILGYGYADDLPQPVTQSTNFIFTPGTDNEPAFPSVADIVHGQYLYRPDSTDVDLYRFTLDTPGRLSIETIAERLGMPSLLDTALRLYRADGLGSFEEVAFNDDYFSNDSLVDLEVQAGTYIVGVSAKGNVTYDPTISGTGFGGLSEGEYELRLDFRPSATNAILDKSGVALDGDADGRPGGSFDFWFLPGDANNTLYVDKASTSAGGNLGTVGNPYREIDQAIAAALPGDTVRVVGNGGIDGRMETPRDNFSYQIGFDNNGLPLADGSSLNVPQGVRLVIDSGAILKLSRSRIGVGSVSPNIDVSDASLQVLGTPSIILSNGLPARDASNTIIPGSVYFTSINDETLGAGNSPNFTPQASPGDWGGIDFRGDLDTADEQRRNRELEGVFLNHLQFADMRFGGGAVSIGGRQVVVSPVDMAITRPTIIHSRITNSADAAMAASPNTFAETRFTDPFFQAGLPFTPDYTRIGPDIHGNFIAENSINGLFIRVLTRTGDVLEKIENSARLDDTDITHVLTENLVIAGTPGGPILQSSAPSSLLVRLLASSAGSVPAGTYVYRITNVSSTGLETAASQPTIPIELTQTGAIQLSQLPTISPGTDFASRRLYRAAVDPVSGLPTEEFRLVAQLNASSTTFVDRAATGTTELAGDGVVLRSRLDARLAIDPATVLKLDGARIEARFGANLIAEGAPGLPIVFTSLEDQRYGGGGTFDTNGRGQSGQLDPGDWGGIYIGHGSTASIDYATVAGAGGTTRIEGGFASFNALEVHQASLRLAHSNFDQNADGRGDLADTRVGRGDNASGTVFVRASQPVILENDFSNGQGPTMTFDINSLSSVEVVDHGRSTGIIDRSEIVGNQGPLIEDNSLDNNTINGLQIRGGQLATAGVWDDVDMVHVVTESIEIPNQHIFGGLRLQSDARGSLVVKFQSDDTGTAGIVVGGSLLTAADELRDIPSRIGGALQLVGHPDFPVVLTTLADDFAGAGFTRDGRAQVDTNNDGVAGGTLASQRLGFSPGGGPTMGGPTFTQLPTGPEVNRGLTIDDDVDVNLPGYFEATPGDGNNLAFGGTGVTVEDLSTGQILVNQDFVFSYNTFITVGRNVTALANTTITQPATLIADDVVESRGNFAGPNGQVDWIATSSFIDGVPTFFTALSMESADGSPLGNIRVTSYLDEDVEAVSDDILVTDGTPGEADFRAFTIDGARRVGFSHGGFYIEDGVNLSNATYVGWAADEFNELQTAILANRQGFSIPGVIDVNDLPPTPDPDFGTSYGPNDVTTAFAWDTLATATTSTITSFLELLPSDPAEGDGPVTFEPGLWNGITVREAADDRNVAAIAEEEPVRSSIFSTNAIPSQSQFLGEIAPRQAAGDENRRLGFVINGAITTRDDVDVYSFIGESGTEVWLDIDKTGLQFDSVVELVDANGRVLAASNDSILAETNRAALYVASDVNPDAAQPLSVVDERLESQQITIGESIVDATDGFLTLTIENSTSFVEVPVDAFLADPATAIASALEFRFGDELGDITASLVRRKPREFDPLNPGAITRAGDDFVIQLRFDDAMFVGRTVPLITVNTSGIVGAVVDASVEEVLFRSQTQDQYTINPKDAGMRIRLPGEANTRNLYHVRVRSSNTRDPLDFTNLIDPNQVRDGLTIGRYELQIRLQETDESPGTQVRLADIRYATTGLQIVGQPLHSPLIGEEYETLAVNDTLAEAQALGYFGTASDLTVTEAGPLQSDRLAKSFAGLIDSPTDVDWYRFEITYENLTRDATSLYLSTVFDLDYADDFARSDMALYVFDSLGQLVLVGSDSNIADDVPGSALNNDTTDLSRGSAGGEDPYIGAAEMSEGVYYVAVANQQTVPLPLDQFFNPNSANALLRLEPVESIRRIAEDRMNFFPSFFDDFGNETQFGDPDMPYGGTAGTPVVPLLFDPSSIVEHTFDDTLLYVNTPTGIFLVNPFTGDTYGGIGGFGGEQIRDIAFRANGELFGYTSLNPGPGDANWTYRQIDTGNGSIGPALSVGGGITTHHDNVGPIILDVLSDDGIQVEAITIREVFGAERGFFVGNRPIDRTGPANGNLDYVTNILYRFDDATGLVTGATFDLDETDAGAGTSRREVGQIDTAVPIGSPALQLGITAATEVNAQGVAVPSLFDGDQFSLNDGLNTETFELDQSFTIIANGVEPVRDGDAVVIDNQTFEFQAGQRLVLEDVFPLGNLTGGTTLTIEAAGGQIATFEFVRLDPAGQNNIPIATLDALGLPLTATAIAADLTAEINTAVIGVGAVNFANEVFFTGDAPTSLIVAGGGGVNIVGDDGLLNAGAIPVFVEETTAPELLIAELASAIRTVGIPVSAAGTQLALPTASQVSLSPDPNLTLIPTALTLTGAPGVDGNHIPILLLPTDTPDILGQRIQAVVQGAVDDGRLDDIVALSPDGIDRRSLRSTVAVFGTTGNLTAGGLPLGGQIRGIELVNNQLYAISDAGGFYQIGSNLLVPGNDANRQIGAYVATATDLVGINFTGLRAGPHSVEDGALSDLLFGITASGDIYAFNTSGEFQPVFAGGRSVVSTGIGGAQGLDFSTLDFNLWHVTNNQSNGGAAGHGINANFNGTRGATPGGASLAFNYEGFFNRNYPSTVELPQFAPRLDGTPVNLTYNFPGGAKGVLQSNVFSLEGFSANDQPTMYFNYFMESDGGADRFRVYVVTESGVEHLVASNTLARGGGSDDDEFDDPDPLLLPIYDDEIDVDIQQLFDNTGSWRQARVPLGEFAGESDLSLRVEFSTGGSTASSSPGLRTKSGDLLIEGQQLIIGGESFAIDLAPALTLPAGIELARFYADPDAVAVITVDGQEYVLDDGNRVVGPTQIGIDLLANAAPGTTLAGISAFQMAAVVADAMRISPPANAVIDGVNLSDPSDVPFTVGTNDLIYEATTLPYSGGNATIMGTGRLGNTDSFGNPINIDDVDLLRVDVIAGTTIAVNVDLDFNTALPAAVRLFDAAGNEVFGTTNTLNDTVSFTAPRDGTVFIGISGLGNEAYDIRLPGTTQPGQIDGYTATIDVNLPQAVLADGNLIEFNGLSSVSATPTDLFRASGQEEITANPIRVSRFMTASDVAESVQRAVATRFFDGDLDLVPTSSGSVKVPGLTITDTGPFADESERYGDLFGGPLGGLSNNAFNGLYIDDFIIGFAERGELATNSNVVDTPFITDLRPQFPLPADPTSNLLTGTYQVEIRDASEYVSSGESMPFRAYDTNDRLTDSRTILARSADRLLDGFTFSIFDGRNTVEFEFDLEESGTGATPGRVRVPFTLEKLVPGTEEVDLVTGLPIPGTGVFRPETAAEVAASIVDAINRTDVQSLIDVPALLSAGVDAKNDATVNLYGEVIIENEDGALTLVDHSILRGDDNRVREAQGVILIENSRFLYNRDYGVDIAQGLTAMVNGVDTESVIRYPRNLVELNTESLKPGVVVQSNVFAFNGIGGLQISGIELGLVDPLDPLSGNVTESASDPISFERIVNNTIIGGTINPGVESPAATFEGVLFDQGVISFADAVVSYTPTAGGSPPALIHQTPDAALSVPDSSGRGPEPIDGQTAVSLGLGGKITLQFTDNLLTGSGDSRPDLVVFETGAVESVLVEISRDNISYFDVGILGGLTNQLDIDAAGFGPEDRFAYIRLTDLRQGDTTGAALGADIDAVGALSTVPIDQFSPAGIGINIVGNVAPALLNNVIANSENAIMVDPLNNRTVLGGNSYYRNTNNVPVDVSLGEFAQVLADAEALFVGPAELIFAPAAGSSIIDSSIDSLEDRPSLTTVKNPLGIPPSPILAPRLDVNGQVRVDDPNVETPGGLGEKVFKDRGASDRGDLAGPRAILISPKAPNLGIGAGVVNVLGQAPSAFEVQLIDGLSPADVVPGTGIDDRSVSGGSVLLLKDNVALIEGIDYRFSYNLSTNVMRLTPIAGVFESDSTYVIRLIDSSDAIVAAQDGVDYVDGSRLSVVDSGGVTTTFEYETGITVEFSTSLNGQTADAITLDIFDGTNLLAVELDSNQVFDPLRLPIAIPAAGNADQVAAAVAAALAASPALNFDINVAGSIVQFLGGTPLSTVTDNSNFVFVSGSNGTAPGFGFQIPVVGAAPDSSVSDGQTFTISRGAVASVTFELDDDNILDDPLATPVILPQNPTLDDIADAIVRAVGGTTLGLSPENAGFGRVVLGGDANYSVDLSLTTFVQLGVAGEAATVPIPIEIDLSAVEIAEVISAVIDATQLGGVDTNIVDTRVFIEGTGGISGTGAVDLITVRDEVGNLLQSNQPNGRTELTIFVGSGFDYGDAPAPYLSLEVEAGPRHAVDPSFSLGPTVTPDSNAVLPNADDDDGIAVLGALQAGFATNVTINVSCPDCRTLNNPDGRVFYVDAWFDWDGDGQFESSEAMRFGSFGSNRSVLGVGTNVISVNVPPFAKVGEIYARFRLSEAANLGPTGDAESGEVEDYRLIVENNPYQNPSGRFDVNDSGAVTPLDALQIINALNRAGSPEIFLPPPTIIHPAFPDVDGNSRVTANDALGVIVELNRLANLNLLQGEQVATRYVPTASGVLASGATLIGDTLIAEAARNETETPQPISTVDQPASEKTSVFDHAAVIELDAVVESLARDTTSADAEEDSETSVLDQVFASL